MIKWRDNLHFCAGILIGVAMATDLPLFDAFVWAWVGLVILVIADLFVAATCRLLGWARL